MDWLLEYWASLDWSSILLAVGLFLVSLGLSLLAIAIVMVKIPKNYFSPSYQHSFMADSPWLVRWGVVIVKNCLGVLLILMGILLSLPGVPGQGVLTILLGLIMIDIPGKRPLEAKIIQRPMVLSAVNDLRHRFNKPPLIMD